MKRLNKISVVSIILISIFIIKSKAQTDPAADLQLQIINDQLGMQAQVNEQNALYQNGQMVTTAGNTAAAASTLTNVLNMMNDAEQTLETVSSVLQTVMYVQDIVTEEKNIVQMQKQISQNSSQFKHLTVAELKEMNDNILNSLKVTESFLTLANQVLSNKTFKMNDHERMSEFFTIKEQMSIQESLMRALYYQYCVIDEERAINSAIPRY